MTSSLNTKPKFSSFGFIVTRNVKCNITNRYWNHCIRCLRNYYPYRKIVIIDDNSNDEFVKADCEYQNVIIIKSEYPGRGELLPYYYFYKNKFFNNAVIIHDSVFFHKKVNFDKYISLPVISLWHFNADKENLANSMRISQNLNNSYSIQENLQLNQINILGFNNSQWYGCFGLQSFINHDFLVDLQLKYSIFNMLDHVKNRLDRCCTERIMGIIFSKEYKSKLKSIFGNIMTYETWGYSYNEYKKDFYVKKRLPKHVVKVWTGR